MKNYYDPKYVEKLFDDMSYSYRNMNYITSFGFSERWRRQFLQGFEVKENEVVVDLMTGMGECWRHIFKQAHPNSRIIALDFSSEMVKRATANKRHFPTHQIDIRKEDILNNSIENGTVDFVISGFGLKTFNTEQLHKLAQTVERMLKIGGQFSLIDISIPNHTILRFFYLFYMKRIIPVLGKLFLGHAETYKMLGIYAEAFGNAREVTAIFEKYDFEVRYESYFFGCASGVRGIKMESSKNQKSQ
jgi:demethylmenaquinone methyltransferase/2-methoxy-6-polyprenyl-1,4-benzoquinol methylase